MSATITSIVNFKAPVDGQDFHNIRLACGMSFTVNNSNPWLRKFIKGYTITIEFTGFDIKHATNDTTKHFVNLKGVTIKHVAPPVANEDLANLPDVDDTTYTQNTTTETERHLRVVRV